jgi:hypothetical protein
MTFNLQIRTVTFKDVDLSERNHAAPRRNALRVDALAEVKRRGTGLG